jgi:hypothetical protein
MKYLQGGDHDFKNYPTVFQERQTEILKIIQRHCVKVQRI